MTSLYLFRYLIDSLFLSESLEFVLIVHCVLCKVYFSAQLNKLRLILKFEKYYPIEHIFVPACSSARKIHFSKLCSGGGINLLRHRFAMHI